ncbi:Cell division protease ftsH [Phytophthora palmivora]|uniref:Cell division protease ftsH n=1 Tax=Phytophthora palmivora TaxID=4796 RepID=A0A2P4YHD6_9STRA|nr:Cell division protease ftsH [Phytophthora palmivora]
MLVLRPHLQLLQRVAARSRPSPPKVGRENGHPPKSLQPASRRSLFNLTQCGKLKQSKCMAIGASSTSSTSNYRCTSDYTLNRCNFPALVVRRVEENRFALDEAVQKEYKEWINE